MTTLVRPQSGGSRAAAAALAGYEPVRTHGFGDILREHSRSRGGKLAVVDGEVRLTYRELNERVDRLAAALRRHGVAEGERVLWIGQNSFRVLEVILAAAKLGAIAAPGNWRCSAAEIMAIVEDFDPKVVFWQEAEVGEVNREAQLNGLEKRVWIGHDLETPEGYEGVLAAAAGFDDERRIDADQPLLGIFTAAFAGRPGAALLSHNALMAQGMMMAMAQQVRHDSVYVVSGPMFHIGVLQAMFSTFMAGGVNIFMHRMEPARLLEMIAAERPTHAYIPPPTIEQMRELNRDGAYDVSSLFCDPQMSDWRHTACMPATAPMAQSSMGGYGQTELSGIAILTWLGGTGAGVPAPFLQVRILDEDGAEVPDGEVGEICARGAMVMCGYWNRPEENARRTAHGWHRTNDLGFRKEDGSIVFVGPKTTMIKSGLENIYPAEVEACIKAHATVAEVCVIGTPDPVWAQNVRAVIVRHPGTDCAELDIIEHCRARIASYKKPKSVIFVDSLPKNTFGFVDRAAVDALHGGGGYPKAGV